MSQLAEIQSAQKSLEECFNKKLSELEAQIQSAGPAKDTVAKIAEEFRTFRELMFTMLGLLRKQINECSKIVDDIDTRHRRKALIFTGFVEDVKEDPVSRVLETINVKLGLNDVTAASIKVCHRLGVIKPDNPRPILVRFSSFEVRSAVWKAKSSLKGTTVTIKEFLTRTRQTVFGRARLHFGMRACWTQDGVIVIKSSDGTRHKVTTVEGLNLLAAKYPKTSSQKVGAYNRPEKAKQ